jgi:rhodanese-related sulfurtransferase
MKIWHRGLLLLLALVPAAFAQTAVLNPNIDMKGFLAVSQAAAGYRESRRVTEAEFIRLSREPGTRILDARSHAMFDLLHVKGAINLNFSDIAVESLVKFIPDKSQRILIYCNNNFRNSPRAFAAKMPSASLNLSTFITLYGYGYTNIYELGPLLDVKATRIELVSSEAK